MTVPVPSAHGEGASDGVDPFPVRKLLVSLVAVAVVGFVGYTIDKGRRANEDAGKQVAIERCIAVPAEVASAIGARVDTTGRVLRHWTATKSSELPDTWFVSVERLHPTHAKGASGQILTWTTANPRAPAADYHSVDGLAASLSSWPKANVRLTVDGGLASRRCVLETRSAKWEALLFNNKERTQP